MGFLRTDLGKLLDTTPEETLEDLSDMLPKGFWTTSEWVSFELERRKLRNSIERKREEEELSND